VFLGLALVGALLGFLPHNFAPARIFLGDTGSLFIGYTLALLALEGYRRVSLITFLAPLLALAVPILDTALSILRRMRSHAPIFSADRLHMHHRLLEAEGSARAAVLQFYFVTAGVLPDRALVHAAARDLRGGVPGGGGDPDAAPAAQSRRARPGRPQTGERRVSRPDHGNHRPGRLLSRGVPARQGIRGARRRAALEHRVVRADRTPARQVVLHQADLLDQSSLVEVCARCARASCTTSARSRSCRPGWLQPTLTGEFTALGVTRLLDAVRHRRSGDPLLPGVELRDVRHGARGRRRTSDAVLSAQPVRGGEDVRPLDHRELPRELRLFAVSGILFNHESPRAGASSSRARSPSGRADQARLQDSSRWATVREARLGLCSRVRRGDVADAPGAEGVDYVIGTGVHHSVRDCLDYAFAHVGSTPTTSCASIPR
jgi:hypothetical protein